MKKLKQFIEEVRKLTEDKMEDIAFDNETGRLTANFELDSEDDGKTYQFKIKAGFFNEDTPDSIRFNVFESPNEEDGEEIAKAGFDVAKGAMDEGSPPEFLDDSYPVDIKRRVFSALKVAIKKFLFEIDFERDREALEDLVPDLAFRIKPVKVEKEEDTEGKETKK